MFSRRFKTGRAASRLAQYSKRCFLSFSTSTASAFQRTISADLNILSNVSLQVNIIRSGISYVFYWLIWMEKRFRVIFDPQKMVKQMLSNEPNSTQNSWFISKRLQVFITSIILLIFAVVLFTTVNFFIKSNVVRQKQELLVAESVTGNSMSSIL
jgi:hypothetical protein